MSAPEIDGRDPSLLAAVAKAGQCVELLEEPESPRPERDAVTAYRFDTAAYALGHLVDALERIDARLRELGRYTEVEVQKLREETSRADERAEEALHRSKQAADVSTAARDHLEDELDTLEEELERQGELIEEIRELNTTAVPQADGRP